MCDIGSLEHFDRAIRGAEEGSNAPRRNQKSRWNIGVEVCDQNGSRGMREPCGS